MRTIIFQLANYNLFINIHQLMFETSSTLFKDLLPTNKKIISSSTNTNIQIFKNSKLNQNINYLNDNINLFDETNENISNDLRNITRNYLGNGIILLILILFCRVDVGSLIN
ncbi:hypothetical protein HERIO_1082 [Hepatospora eriocheir]|uniref:Uncharacterized protein n=1 Tax=Hepatospora eriocheir TaxID=1081669 RepID=A0A1X0QB27_9MICR|nr:hypothetical protein HERIO_1082 [Hepatospora eriocheir]